MRHIFQISESHVVSLTLDPDHTFSICGLQVFSGFLLDSLSMVFLVAKFYLEVFIGIFSQEMFFEGMDLVVYKFS